MTLIFIDVIEGIHQFVADYKFALRRRTGTAAVLAAGGFGLAVTTTIIAAIIAQALTRGALFSVLSLPLLLPLLIFLIQGTTAVATGDLETYSNSLRAVLSMAGVMTVVSALLFPVVWND